MAGGALEPAIAQRPSPRVAAIRAYEPVRPPQPLQVVQTVHIRAEPGQEVTGRRWVVDAGPWGRGHKVILLRLSGDPNCATRRFATSPAQSEGTRREVSGSDGFT
jgi:hypothetical protein